MGEKLTEKISEDGIKLKKFDCRFCKNFRYDIDIEIESFFCEAGYFNFTEGDKREGNYAEMPPLVDNPQVLPCKGDAFVFGPTTGRWKELAKECIIP